MSMVSGLKKFSTLVSLLLDNFMQAIALQTVHTIETTPIQIICNKRVSRRMMTGE